MVRTETYLQSQSGNGRSSPIKTCVQQDYYRTGPIRTKITDCPPLLPPNLPPGIKSQCLNQWSSHNESIFNALLGRQQLLTAHKLLSKYEKHLLKTTAHIRHLFWKYLIIHLTGWHTRNSGYSKWRRKQQCILCAWLWWSSWFRQCSQSYTVWR